MAWVLGIYGINTVLMVFVAFREARRPANALCSLILLQLLPLLGFLFYLFVATPLRLPRRRLTASSRGQQVLPSSFLPSTLITAKALNPFSVNGLGQGKIQMLTNGQHTFEALRTSIALAQHSIDMEYYIFRNDKVGKSFVDLLINKARAGVSVRFLKDGWGSRSLPNQVLRDMKAAGIQCRTFFPLRFSWLKGRLNYRDHCKIVIIDGKEAFTGGINIGEEYTGKKKNVGFWRDTHLCVVGESVADLQDIFNSHWETGSRTSHETTTHVPTTNSAQVVRSANFKSTSFSAEVGLELGTASKYLANSSCGPRDAFIQTFEGNPGLSTQVIRIAYFTCATQSTYSMDITTPYFIPDDDIIMALKTAVSRGVRVRLLLPKKIDHKVVDLASPTYYGELLEAGVEIYLYTKGILHAKVMVVDGEVSLVGAANMDMRSFHLDYEVCKVVYSREVASDLTGQFERDLREAYPITAQDLTKRSAITRVAQQGARILAPLL